MDGKLSIALRHQPVPADQGLRQFSQGGLNSSLTAPRRFTARQIEQTCFYAGRCVALSDPLGELP